MIQSNATQNYLEALGRPLLSDANGRLYCIEAGELRLLKTTSESTRVDDFGSLPQLDWLLSDRALLIRTKDGNTLTKPRPQPWRGSSRSTYPVAYGLEFGGDSLVVVWTEGTVYLALISGDAVYESAIETDLNLHAGWVERNALYLGGNTARQFSGDRDEELTRFGRPALLRIEGIETGQEKVDLDFQCEASLFEKLQSEGVEHAETIVSAYGTRDHASWVLIALATHSAPEMKDPERFTRRPLRMDHADFVLARRAAGKLTIDTRIDGAQFVGSLQSEDDRTCFYFCVERTDSGEKRWPMLIERIEANGNRSTLHGSIAIEAPYFYEPLLLHHPEIGFYGYIATGARDETRHHLLRSEDGIDWTAHRFDAGEPEFLK